MKEYLLFDYDDGTTEIVDEYELDEKVEFIRGCGGKAVAREIIYGEKVVDDVTPYFKKINANRKRAETIARKKAEAEAS